MKMIYCTCNVAILESLLNMLDENNVRDFQVVEQVTAKNKKGNHRFNNAVWPGYNSSVFIQIAEDEKAKLVMQKIREFNQNAFNENELVTACLWTMEDYFFE